MTCSEDKRKTTRMPKRAAIAFRAVVEKNRTSLIRLQCIPPRYCEQRPGRQNGGRKNDDHNVEHLADICAKSSGSHSAYTSKTASGYRQPRRRRSPRIIPLVLAVWHGVCRGPGL